MDIFQVVILYLFFWFPKWYERVLMKFSRELTGELQNVGIKVADRLGESVADASIKMVDHISNKVERVSHDKEVRETISESRKLIEGLVVGVIVLNEVHKRIKKGGK